jgi:hypothetical protein
MAAPEASGQHPRKEDIVADEPETSNEGPLDRAFAILTFVAEQKKALSAAEIAAALDLPLATAHRLIGNLESRGLIQKALGTKRYVVGSTLVTLAAKTIGAAFRTVRRHAVLSAVAIASASNARSASSVTTLWSTPTVCGPSSSSKDCSLIPAKLLHFTARRLARFT